MRVVFRICFMHPPQGVSVTYIVAPSSRYLASTSASAFCSACEAWQAPGPVSYELPGSTESSQPLPGGQSFPQAHRKR